MSLLPVRGITRNTGQSQSQVSVNLWPATGSLCRWGFRRACIFLFCTLKVSIRLRAEEITKELRAGLCIRRFRWRTSTRQVQQVIFSWGGAIIYEQQRNKGGTETGQGNGADTEEVLSTRGRHQAKITHGSKARMAWGRTRLWQA